MKVVSLKGSVVHRSTKIIIFRNLSQYGIHWERVNSSVKYTTCLKCEKLCRNLQRACLGFEQSSERKKDVETSSNVHMSRVCMNFL